MKRAEPHNAEEGGPQRVGDQFACKSSVSCICLIYLITNTVKSNHCVSASSGTDPKEKMEESQGTFYKNEAIPPTNERKGVNRMAQWAEVLAKPGDSHL